MCEDNEDGQEERKARTYSGPARRPSGGGMGPGALAHALTGLCFLLGLVFADPTVQEFVRSPAERLCVRTLEAGALAFLLLPRRQREHRPSWPGQGRVPSAPPDARWLLTSGDYCFNH